MLIEDQSVPPSSIAHFEQFFFSASKTRRLCRTNLRFLNCFFTGIVAEVFCFYN